MKNVLAVLTIAATAIAALTMAGGGATRGIPPAADEARAAAEVTVAVPAAGPGPAGRWEYRVVSTREALVQAHRRTRSGGESNGGDPNVRFIARAAAVAAAEADALKRVEQELNQLGGDGWEMCSASDGTLVFRRAL